MRSLKPWIEDWSADAEVYASKLRDLSVSDWAIESHVNERLKPQLRSSMKSHGSGTTSAKGKTSTTCATPQASLLRVDALIWSILSRSAMRHSESPGGDCQLAAS